MNTRLWLPVLSAMLLGATANAAPLTKAQEKAAATIKQNLESRFENVNVLSVVPSTQLPGLYEVFTGDAVSYANASGDFVFVGSVIETATKRDLTRDRVDELNSVDFKSLPFARAIKIVKGKGTRQLAVFSDPDCPFCQQLEKDLVNVDDVTVHIFLFPLKELHPDAPAHARAVWCANDRAAAWTGWMLERKSPELKMCEGDPVDELHTLAGKLRITSTPTLIAESGKRFAGAMGKNELEKFLGSPASAVAQGPGGATPTGGK
jgi:thiol:disulfide interchange protein DsbC